LPFSRLTWFGPSARLKLAMWRNGIVAAERQGLLRQSNGEIFQRLDVAAQRIREPHNDLEAAIALEHQAGRAPADGYADRILHVRKAQTAARDLALVDLDL